MAKKRKSKSKPSKTIGGNWGKSSTGGFSKGMNNKMAKVRF